jgi:hypothetical protein
MSLKTLNEVYATGNNAPIVGLVFKITYQKYPTRYTYLKYYLGNDVQLYLDGSYYSPSSFQVALPTKNDSGFTDLNFAICNVDNKIYDLYKRYYEEIARWPSYVILQQFHPETKVKEYELELTVTGVQFTPKQANFTASFCDMLNTEFPQLRYTQQNCPGLKYVSP